MAAETRRPVIWASCGQVAGAKGTELGAALSSHCRKDRPLSTPPTPDGVSTHAAAVMGEGEADADRAAAVGTHSRTTSPCSWHRGDPLPSPLDGLDISCTAAMDASAAERLSVELCSDLVLVSSLTSLRYKTNCGDIATYVCEGCGQKAASLGLPSEGNTMRWCTGCEANRGAVIGAKQCDGCDSKQCEGCAHWERLLGAAQGLKTFAVADLHSLSDSWTPGFYFTETWPLAAALGCATNCPELLDLSVTSSHLGPVGARLLANSLHARAKLRRLDISNNGIGDTGAWWVAEALRSALGDPGRRQGLNRLNMATNQISVQGACFLALALGGSELDRASRSVHDAATEETWPMSVADPDAPPACPNLEEIILHDNALGPAGAGILAKGLLRGCAHLQSMDIGGNGLGDEGAARVAVALAAAAGKDPRGEERTPMLPLQFMYTELVTSGRPRGMIQGPVSMSDLVCLKQARKVSDTGMVALHVLDVRDPHTCVPQQRLGTWMQLRTLFSIIDPLAQRLRPSASEAAAGTEVRALSLCCLNMGQNSIGDEGSAWLAAALAEGFCPLIAAQNTGGLDVRYNRISSAGASRLSNSFRRN